MTATLSLKMLLGAILLLIPVGVGLRIVICLLKINTDPDQASAYKTRIKHALIYAVIAESVSGILTIVYSYLT